jgi:hypothetical protein
MCFQSKTREIGYWLGVLSRDPFVIVLNQITIYFCKNTWGAAVNWRDMKLVRLRRFRVTTTVALMRSRGGRYLCVKHRC